MPSAPRSCAVALPLPAAEPYSYAIPPGLADRIVPGSRVVVPVRAREMIGVVVALEDATREDLKPVLLAPDPHPLVPESLVRLARWVSRRYAAPLGLALRGMLPGALWGQSRLVAVLENASAGSGGASRPVVQALERAGGRAAASSLARALKRPVWDQLQRLSRAGAVSLTTEPPDLGPRAGVERIIALTEVLSSLTERDRTFGRAAKQRAAYDALDAMGGEGSAAKLREMGFSPAVLNALVKRGLAAYEERERYRDPFHDAGSAPPDAVTADQKRVLGLLDGLPEGGVALLFGVTGSGKTLVYLEALRRAVESGRGAIILVPEIALTTQTVARVRGVFGDAVAVLHSGLSDAERADAWRAVARGDRRLVVGARSAVFAPVADLAWLVVDEEHEPSYKHGGIPRYHARDAALARARIEGARVILASATPSLETWAARDRITVVELPERVGAHPLPAVRLVDLRTAQQIEGSGAVPWSAELDSAIRARLDVGDQVLLLLNRRGFAHYLQCPSCGGAAQCPSCSIALTIHESPARLRCHYCGHSEAVPSVCPECGGATQRARGVGTQQLERWLSHRYRQARLARMDADTTATKWSHRKILGAVERREVDILFGTQMIAKGLDFPGVTLVGVVDADTGLHLPDFRAAERTFQLIAQVAGRAGRGPRGGEVLVQTRRPDHPALVAAARHDLPGFAAQEVEARRSPPYPPHAGLANVLVSGFDEASVADAAVEVAQWIRGLIRERAEGRVEVVGPAPAPLARIKGRWRWHLLLRSQDREWLGRLVRYTARRAPHAGKGPIRLVVDRDPVSLL